MSVECPTCGGPVDEQGLAMEGWPWEWEVAGRLRVRIKELAEMAQRLLAELAVVRGEWASGEELLTRLANGIGAQDFVEAVDLALQLRAQRVALAAALMRYLTADDTGEDMCPNCVTPWKCNGPHLSMAEEARTALDSLKKQEREVT